MGRHHAGIITLAALSAVAVAAPAQDAPRREREREARGFSFVITGDSGDVRLFDSRRGRIGISVSLAPDARRDSIGALVEDVVARGPAARAGVRTGDLIARWNGVRLSEGEGDGLRSRPGQRLINLAQRLEPGDTVRLEIRREGRTQNVAVVADSADMDRIVERIRIPLPGMGEMRMPFQDPGASRLRVFAFDGSGLADVELVNVGPALAQGLGIAEGVLVVEAGRDTALGLRAGDVIVAIGGRRPTSPSHAMRILSTYEPGEAVQFDLMRQRRRQSVSGRMPEPRPGEWRIRRNSLERTLPREFEHLFRELQDELPRRLLDDHAPRHRVLEIQGTGSWKT